MCTIIEADCIIANAFAAGRHSVSIRDLKLIRSIVERNINGVFVDVSLNAIMDAVDIWPDMFEWHDGEVIRPEGSASLFTEAYIEDIFNWRIPKSFRKVVISLVQTNCHGGT